MQSYQELGEPSPVFIKDLPHPKHNRIRKLFYYRKFMIAYFKKPKSFGDIDNFPSLYEYPHVAVILEQGEAILIVRTEVNSFLGTTFICLLSRDGSHKNFGSFERASKKKFLQEVMDILSGIDDSEI